MKERVLGIIPARGGSKGIPRKNILPVLGKPLICYTIESALKSGVFFRLICSTDDKEIARIARKHGAEVPFLRPKSLARDDTSMVPVLQHAVNFIEKQEGRRVDFVFCLQPTNPLRAPEDIISGVRKIKRTGADSVIGVVKVDSDHPILMKKIVNSRLMPYILEEKEGTRRQDYKPYAYKRSGSVYIVKRDILMEKNSLWGDYTSPLILPKKRSIGIDERTDLLLTELILKQGRRKNG